MPTKNGPKVIKPTSEHKVPGSMHIMKLIGMILYPTSKDAIAFGNGMNLNNLPIQIHPQ